MKSKRSPENLLSGKIIHYPASKWFVKLLSSLMKTTSRVWAIFDRALTAMLIFSATIIVFDAFAISTNALGRKFIGVSYAGLFEITNYSLLWITFLGGAWLLKVNGHVRLDVVLNRLNPTPRSIVNIMSSCIGALLLAFVTYYSIRLIISDFTTGRTLHTVLVPPAWIVELIIPFGTFFLSIEFCRKIYAYLLEYKKHRPGNAVRPR